MIPWWRILGIVFVVLALGLVLRWLGRIASRGKVMSRNEVTGILETFVHHASQSTEVRPVAVLLGSRSFGSRS